MIPEVSVVLPFFNAEQTLARAVSSILDQSFPDFELILVDNNSTDSSSEIAGLFAVKDDRIKMIREENQGVVFAMNKGMELARGQFIARMDADDVSHPKRLKKQFQFLIDNPEIGLVGCNVRHVSDLPSEGMSRFVDWVNSFHLPKEIWQNRFVEIPLIQPSVMFRSHLWQVHGNYKEGDFPEDYELFLRWLDAGVRFAKLNETLLDWHDSEKRLTRTDSRYNSGAFYKTKAFYFAKWFSKSIENKELWIWGAGRKSRQRAKLLEQEGVQISGYFDFKDKTIAGKECKSYKDIRGPGKTFILSMVGNYGAREQIISFLNVKGYQIGEDYLVMS